MTEPRPYVALAGEDGNAFAIMGRVTKALKRAGASPDYVKRYQDEATSGDYDHLLQVTLQFIETSWGDDEGGDDD